MNIGLTGGIATGKSTVSGMLAERGAFLIDADKIAREIVMPGSPVLQSLFAAFGYGLRNEDGTLNRKKLGEIVFADEQARAVLNGLTHPPIRALMTARMKEAEAADPRRLVVVDVPLLFESKLTHYFNETLLVYAPPDVQLIRLMERDGISEEQARSRLNAQMSIEAKRELADVVIDNSGSVEDTKRQVDGFWQKKGKA